MPKKVQYSKKGRVRSHKRTIVSNGRMKTITVKGHERKTGIAHSPQEIKKIWEERSLPSKILDLKINANPISEHRWVVSKGLDGDIIGLDGVGKSEAEKRIMELEKKAQSKDDNSVSMHTAYAEKLVREATDKIPINEKWDQDRSNIHSLIETGLREGWDIDLFNDTLEANMDLILEKVERDKRREERLRKKEEAEKRKEQKEQPKIVSRELTPVEEKDFSRRLADQRKPISTRMQEIERELEKIDRELGFIGNDYRRMDTILKYPKNEKEEKLVAERKRLGKELIATENNENQFAIMDQIISERTKPQKKQIPFTPDSPKQKEIDLTLGEGEKYYIIEDHGYSGSPPTYKKTLDDAIKVLNEEIELAKKYKLDDSPSIIVPAKNVDEARAKVRNLGRIDVIVSDTEYQDRYFYKNFGLKWDYSQKAWRGKVAPETMEKLQSKGATVEKDSEFTYEEQHEARKEKLLTRAEKREEWAGSAKKRSDIAFEKERAISEHIPFGQPILVGHHSEKHARKDAEKIWKNAMKGFEEMEKSEEHLSKAENLRRMAMSKKGDAARANERKIKAMALEPGDRVWSYIYKRSGTVEKVFKKSAKINFDDLGSRTEAIILLEKGATPPHLRKKEESNV